MHSTRATRATHTTASSRSSHRRRILTSAVGLATVAGALVAAPATASTPKFGHYVALGDSYAAVGGQSKLSGGPAASGCGRSAVNYAHDLAASLATAVFTDVSCGGAVTANMTQPQTVTDGVNPAQFDALTADTDLVTITIGGNDLGFGDIVNECAQLSIANPGGNPCQQHYTAGGTDQLKAKIAALAPTIAATVQGVHQRSPHATVVVVGYLPILPTNWGCWPAVPVAHGDVAWVSSVQTTLDGMLAQTAAANGALSVNPGGTVGHSACEWPWNRWTEPAVGNDANTVVLHPNAAGQAAVTQMVRAMLNG